MAHNLWQRRQRKGVTLPEARSRLKSRTWFASMMVRDGLADGLVGGIGRPYRQTLSPALQAIGTDPNARIVSGVYALIIGDQKIFLGDCTVNMTPDAETLAEIAYNTARVARTFGVSPRVAMLSYSDFGDHHQDPRVTVVREAVERVRSRWPDLEVDGEMQADTALNNIKRQSNFPFSTLSDTANVLVFPDLTSGNLAHKLITQLTDAEGLGPLLVGLAAPVNVIPVGASVGQIVDVATYTVNQALDRERQ
jgi:malate dehydrogenase (oxaloacetate-decarboxylating)(NADP+)